MEEKENTKNNLCLLCLRFETKTPKLDQKLLAGTKNKQSVHVH